MFEAKITEIRLKADKDKETNELITIMVFRGESQVKNTEQIVGLWKGFQQQLITVKFSPYDQHDNDFELKDVRIDTFNIKNKKIRIGHGRDSEYENVDYLFFVMMVKTDMEGECLKKMHSIFQETVGMEIY